MTLHTVRKELRELPRRLAESVQELHRVPSLTAAAMLAALWPHNAIRRMEDFKPAPGRAVVLALLTAWSVLSFTGVTTFIYSNF